MRIILLLADRAAEHRPAEVEGSSRHCQANCIVLFGANKARGRCTSSISLDDFPEGQVRAIYYAGGGLLRWKNAVPCLCPGRLACYKETQSYLPADSKVLTGKMESMTSPP